MKNQQLIKTIILVMVGILLSFSLYSEEPATEMKPQNLQYQKVKNKLDEGGLLYLYMSTNGFLRLFMDEMRKVTKNTGVETTGWIAVADQFIDMLGLYEVKALGTSVIKKNNMHHMKCYIHVPGEKKGLLGLAGGEPHDFKILDYAPEDTVILSSFDLDVDEVISLVREMVQRIGGVTALSEFNKETDRVGQQLGTPVDAIISHMDNNFAIIGKFSRDNPIIVKRWNKEDLTLARPSVVILMKAKDEQLYQDVKRFFSTKNMTGSEKEMEGAKIMSMDVQENEKGKIAPAIGFDGEYVFLTMQEELLKELVQVKKNGNSLRNNPDFRNLRTNLPEKGNELFYVSETISANVKEYMNFLTSSMENQSGSMRGGKAWPLYFGEMIKNMDEAGGMVSVRVNEPEGFYAVTNSTGNALETYLHAGLAPSILLGAAFTSENIADSGLKAQTSRVKADLRSMATALEAYNVDWNQYPPSPEFSTIMAREGEGVIEYYPRAITTPIAYLTRIFQDPFSKEAPYLYYRIDGKENPELAQDNMFWILWSRGPDGVSNINEKSDLLKPALYDMMYDPTNGMMSPGDIIRSTTVFSRF